MGTRRKTTSFVIVDASPQMDRIPYSAVTILVTPDMASDWLDKVDKTHNRTPGEKKVVEFTKDMTAGRWQQNGDSIKFDWNDVLIDGQHRLWAILESGRAQTMIVVRGLDPLSLLTIDQGTRRSPHDQMSVAGIKMSAGLVAAARVYLTWTNGQLFGDVKKNSISTSVLVEWAQRNVAEVQLLREFESKGYKKISNMPRFTFAAALRFTLIDMDASLEFFAGMLEGTNLTQGSPILALRERFLKTKTDGIKLSDKDILGFYVIAWNAFRDGRSLHKLQRPTGGQFLVGNFPEPK